MPSGSTQDSLTGLPGREVVEVLDPTFSVRRAGEVWSVIALDLNDFKALNEIHGRLTADRVLQQTSYMLARNVKQTDEILRLGADEFAILLPSTTASQAANLAQRLLEAVQREQYPEDLHVSFCLGLSESADEDRSLDPVIDRALKALRDSRSSGAAKLHLPSDRLQKATAPQFDHFVDRFDEIKALRDSLDSAITNGLSFVLLSGEAGVGKTRLALELRHYAGFRDCLFAEIDPEEGGRLSGIPLFTGSIRYFLSSLRPEEMAEFASSTEPVSAAAAALLPGIELPASAQDESSAGSRPLHKELTSILLALSRCRPLVIVLDNFHEMGSQELEEITHLAAAARSARLLLVLCARTPDTERGNFVQRLALIGKFATMRILELKPLSDEHSVNSASLALRSSGLSPREVTIIAARARGNPLFMEELLKWLHEAGLLASGGIPAGSSPAGMPGSMAEAVRKRLDGLPLEVRSILRLASLLEGRFDPALPAMAADVGVASVIDALDAAVARGFLLVERDGTGKAEYRFAHSLFRELLAEELDEDSKKSVHSSLGRHFEEGSGSGSIDSARRAAYFHSKGKDRHRAAEPALLAAGDAKARGASRELEEWLELYDELHGDINLPSEMRFAHRIELGALLYGHGRYARAMDILTAAETDAAAPSQAAEVHFHLGRLHLEIGELEKALQYFESVPESEEGSPTGMGALISSASLKYRMGSAREALELLQRVGKNLSSMPASADRDCLEADYLSVLGVILSFDDDTEKGEVLCRQAVERAERCGRRDLHARTVLALSDALSHWGVWEERHRLVSKSASVLRENGDLEEHARALLKLGLIHLSLNQFDAAVERVRRSMDLAELIGSSGTGIEAEFCMGLVEDGKDNPEQALLHYSNSMERASRFRDERVSLQCGLKAALTLAKLGSSAQARTLLGSLDRRGTPEKVGLKLHADLRLTRAIVEYLDREAGGTDSLTMALEILRDTGSHYEGRYLLSSLEASWYEALCLKQLGRDAAAASLVEGSCQSIEMLLDAMDSPFIREDFKRTDFIHGLLDLRKDVDFEHGREKTSPSQPHPAAGTDGSGPAAPERDS